MGAGGRETDTGNGGAEDLVTELNEPSVPARDPTTGAASPATSQSLEAPVATPPPRAQSRRLRTARIIAIAADVLQVVLFPAFAAGWISPLNDALDVVVAVIMVRLVGWHFAFLPTFVAELVPGVDLIPTWTAAVWFATRGGVAGRQT